MSEEYLTITELSEYLGISEATVRNWIKLGKVVATKQDKKTVIFKGEVQKLSESISSSKMLTSRRNKSRLGSNYIPRSYISKKSPNYKTILSMIGTFQEESLDITEVISFCADMLMTTRGITKEIRQSLLPDNFSDTNVKEFSPVGTKKANKLAIYDMTGNVAELPSEISESAWTKTGRFEFEEL